MISYRFRIQILIKKSLSPPMFGPKKSLLGNKRDLSLLIEALFPSRVKGEAVLLASPNWFLINMLKTVKTFQIALSRTLNQAKNSRRIRRKSYLVLLKK